MTGVREDKWGRKAQIIEVITEGKPRTPCSALAEPRRCGKTIL